VSETRVALVTGASSGIGAATVRSLAAAGFEVVGGARRVERVEEIVGPIGGRAVRLDVTDPASVAEVAESLPELSVLVNNAGGALGLEPVAEADEAHWREMYETNLMGVMRVTKALLPALERGDGSCSASRFASRRWRLDWSRPSSRSSASAETRRRPTRSMRGPRP
jgi:NADP-dependent 3-hydroxy acid dehydrogenase YdfG